MTSSVDSLSDTEVSRPGTPSNVAAGDFAPSVPFTPSMPEVLTGTPMNPDRVQILEFVQDPLIER